MNIRFQNIISSDSFFCFFLSGTLLRKNENYFTENLWVWFLKTTKLANSFNKSFGSPSETSLRISPEITFYKNVIGNYLENWNSIGKSWEFLCQSFWMFLTCFLFCIFSSAGNFFGNSIGNVFCCCFGKDSGNFLEMSLAISFAFVSESPSDFFYLCHAIFPR